MSAQNVQSPYKLLTVGRIRLKAFLLNFMHISRPFIDMYLDTLLSFFFFLWAFPQLNIQYA